MSKNNSLQVVQVATGTLKAAEYNPRKWSDAQAEALKESIRRFGLVDPLIANSKSGRKNVLIGGHFRLKVAKELGIKEVPVVFVELDIEKEKELNLRLNKNTGDFDLELLKEFTEEMLADVGFNSEDLDEIFHLDPTPQTFDLNKELKKAGVNEVSVKEGDVYECDGLRLMCGDSTKQEDMLRLMNGEKADLCLTDPPYLLDYLRGKQKHGKPTEGFGMKRNRKYLGTDVLPPDFTEKWMTNVAAIANKDFSILVFENPKNLRTIWNELEKHWRYRNTIVWHIPNRVQGFSTKYKFFNKHDIALVGTGGDVSLNTEPEDESLLQEEYETALYATSGSPHREGYAKGKKTQPTDFIEHVADDEKSSGQGVIFGTKPLEVLMPYLKVLSKRGDVVVEPFGGSGSTAVAALKLKRRCFIMEKSPVYAAVIIARLEKVLGVKAKKIS